MTAQASPMPKPSPVTSVEDLVDAGRRLDMVNSTAATSFNLQRSTLTPPPDAGTTNMLALEKQPNDNVTDEEVARRLETFLASTPPESDHEHMPSITISEDVSMSGTTAPAMHITSHNDAFHKWTTMDLPPNPFGNINHHQDNEMLFSSLPLNNEFDEGDFDSLLNLDAVGETFTFDDSALEGGLGDVDWLGTGDVGISMEA